MYSDDDFKKDLQREQQKDNIPYEVITKEELKIKYGEVKQMQSIKESAQAFTPKQTKNIAELKEVSVDLKLEEREGTNRDDGTVFKYKVVVVNGEEYRVPGKVIGDLKSILEKKPNLKTFAVSKKGSGLNTLYTVIPLE